MKCPTVLSKKFNYCFLIFFFFIFSITAFANNCKPFLIYKNMDHPYKGYSKLNISEKSDKEIISLISSLPGHTNFKNLYKSKQMTSSEGRSYLTCLYGFLIADYDKDGVFDWKITSRGQLLSKLIPQDDDWDNDGISNLFDSRPLKKDLVADLQDLPKHLLLDQDRGSKANSLQEKLLNQCGVLALNYTDIHSYSNLENFLKICEISLKRNPKSNSIMILYAFASHAFTNDSLASFYPELNAMSIGGSSYEENFGFDENYSTKIIAHELGHYFIFNHLTPKELKLAACEFGYWTNEKGPLTSFFDKFFLKSYQNNKTGYLPTAYSKINIHEWFSEVFADHLFRKLNFKRHNSQEISPLASQFDDWISSKLKN